MLTCMHTHACMHACNNAHTHTHTHVCTLVHRNTHKSTPIEPTRSRLYAVGKGSMYHAKVVARIGRGGPAWVQRNLIDPSVAWEDKSPVMYFRGMNYCPHQVLAWLSAFVCVGAGMLACVCVCMWVWVWVWVCVGGGGAHYACCAKLHKAAAFELKSHLPCFSLSPCRRCECASPLHPSMPGLMHLHCGFLAHPLFCALHRSQH